MLLQKFNIFTQKFTAIIATLAANHVDCLFSAYQFLPKQP